MEPATVANDRRNAIALSVVEERTGPGRLVRNSGPAVTEEYAMRRLVVCLVVLATLMIGIGLSVALGQESSLESGALRLSKSEIEADFGTVEKPVVVPGHAIYDETFAYETQAGTLYVSYRDVNGEMTAVYVEFAWRGDGASEQAAREMVAHLIPADASLTELYVAPPTSSGPVALVTHRYESE